MEQYHQLTQSERYLIAQLRQQGVAARTIALRLGRHRSTVYREVKRNATAHDGAYRPHKAHVYAGARRWKARSKPQYSDQELDRVNQLLREDLSPEQCAGVLRLQGLSISWPTIYRHIRRDRRQGGTLWRHLRIIPKFGRKRYRSQDSRGVLPGKTEAPSASLEGRACGPAGNASDRVGSVVPASAARWSRRDPRLCTRRGEGAAPSAMG